MKMCNQRSVWVAIVAAAVIGIAHGQCAFGQNYQSYPNSVWPNSTTAPAASGAPANSSQRPIIIIQHHHHHYYYPPAGLAPLAAQQADPASVAGAGYLGASHQLGAEPTPEGGSWGGIGLYAYLGQQGQHGGLIVTRVKPNSPASQLGLVARDVILTVNGQDVNEMSNRQLQILFLGLTTQAKQAVTMDVWNSYTGRTSTLKGEFENKQVQQFENADSEDAP